MLAVTRIWIVLSTLLVAAGWILSALHELNGLGYGIVFAVAGLTWLAFREKKPFVRRDLLTRAWHKFRRRCRRPMPLFFFLMALMSLVGGVLYISSDLDGLAYRVPRIFHWLERGQWHWIYTADYRMNVAGCGFEWLCAPLVLFTHTDRLLSLINGLSFIMLPGLIFSVLIRLGVRPRAAWWWMWLLGSGWCYVFQAGSTHNDSMAAIYVLASVDLALRARERQSAGDLWLSLLAAALVTGVKQTNMPLALLWLIAAWPSRRLFFRNWFGGAVAGLVGLLVSGLPVTLLNLHETGVWTGIPKDAIKAEIHSPFWGIIGNTFCLSAQNLAPPVFPLANRWDTFMGGFEKRPLAPISRTLNYLRTLTSRRRNPMPGSVWECVLWRSFH